MRFPVSGPALWAGGDSPLRCSWWSWRTASSWTRRSPWEMTRLCAASREQRRGGRGKATSPVRNQTEQHTGHPQPQANTHTLIRIEPKSKAASNYIKMYHTAKSTCKWGRLVMLLKTWSAATWLDETVFIATVLAKWFGWCCPQQSGHDHPAHRSGLNVIGSRQGGGEGGQQLIQQGLHHLQEREERGANWAASEIDVSLMLKLVAT